MSFLSDADLNIAQTAWGDSGVYLCSVASDQDLTGNGECYTELIVLGQYPSFVWVNIEMVTSIWDDFQAHKSASIEGNIIFYWRQHHKNV